MTRKEAKITRIEILSTGYVRVECKDANQYWGWAQMPISVWEKLKKGQKIPDKYIFPNEYSRLMPILIK